MMALAQRAIGALEETYAPHGYNVGFNQGRVAGAGVEHHIHMHVVPRWGGDTNFMPVLGDTRVMPQSLEDSYEALRGHALTDVLAPPGIFKAYDIRGLYGERDGRDHRPRHRPRVRPGARRRCADKPAERPAGRRSGATCG